MKEIDLEKILNPSQYEAVTTVDGPLLVIAGAGSGKTRAIEYRVFNLVRRKIAPRSILLLTFTRKAAHEMISRACRHDPRCKDVEGGTFHSFAFRTLKKYAKALGISSQFSILDESDSAEAVGKCTAKLGLHGKDKKYPRKDTVRAIISMSINKASSIGETIEKEYPHFVRFAEDVEAIRREYAAYKINKNYMDYDDLLIYLKLLLQIDGVRGRLSQAHSYIMVDEYQDTNKLQGDIAHLLAGGHKNIMAVGDDAQSIYGFRGSSHRNIMEFPKRFPGCKIIKLEENYRSTQRILDIANTVLENMNNKYSKCLVSTRDDEGAKPDLNFFKNGYDEAGWVASKIKELRDKGVELKRQAVLFRSAYVSIPLQAELNREGIPYQVFGGLRFYETAHVKDITSHLKVLVNHKDEIAWNRVLTLLDGIGPATADKLTEEVIGSRSLAEAAEKVLSEKRCQKASSKGLKRLGSFLKSAKGYSLSPEVLYGLAYDYYQPIFKEKFDDWHIRTNDLEALRQISSRYRSIEDFLADFAIEPPERGVADVAAKSKDDEAPLTLSTIHSAKGLEWDTVFLIGLVDGVLPSSFALNDDEEIEEESRLFYVAITRAKNRLYLSLSHEGSRGGIIQFNKISRFLDYENVLSRLEQKTVSEDMEERGYTDEGPEMTPAYDRGSLLKDIIELI